MVRSTKPSARAMLPATRMGREPCRYIEAYGGKKGVAVGRVCWGLWLCSTRWHYYFHDLRVDRAATGARDELLNTVAANHSSFWRLQVCNFSFLFLPLVPLLFFSTRLPRLPQQFSRLRV